MGERMRQVYRVEASVSPRKSIFNRIKFTVEPKKNKLLENQSSNLGVTLTEEVIVLIELGIAEAMAKKWAKEYGKDNVLKACRFVRAKQKAGEVKDIPAYLAKALKDGYYVGWIEGENKKEAKRSAENARNSPGAALHAASSPLHRGDAG